VASGSRCIQSSYTVIQSINQYLPVHQFYFRH